MGIVKDFLGDFVFVYKRECRMRKKGAERQFGNDSNGMMMRNDKGLKTVVLRIKGEMGVIAVMKTE